MCRKYKYTVYTNVMLNEVSPSRMHDFQTHYCFYTVTHRICSTLASHFIEFLMISNLIILSTILRALKRVSGPATGNNINFSSCLNILREFNFTCSNTLELNCTDSLIQMCAKFSRMSGIYLFYFLQNGSVTITQS